MFPHWGRSQILVEHPGWRCCWHLSLERSSSATLGPGRDGIRGAGKHSQPAPAPSHSSLIPKSSSEVGLVAWREGKSRRGAELVQLRQEQLWDGSERFGCSTGQERSPCSWNKEKSAPGKHWGITQCLRKSLSNSGFTPIFYSISPTPGVWMEEVSGFNSWPGRSKGNLGPFLPDLSQHRAPSWTKIQDYNLKSLQLESTGSHTPKASGEFISSWQHINSPRCQMALSDG